MRRCVKCGGLLWPWGRSRLRDMTHRRCYVDADMEIALRCERRMILAAKQRGATDYVFVSLCDIPGTGKTKGENLAKMVLDKWPGAIPDRDKCTDKVWAFLLPPTSAP